MWKCFGIKKIENELDVESLNENLVKIIFFHNYKPFLD